jgi:hypothetical protein
MVDSKAEVFEYLAALWAFVFAALHIAWAMGFYVGLEEAAARAAFQRSWFLAYDMVAAALCVLGGALALSRARRVLFSVGAMVLALRAIGGALQVAHAIATGRDLSERTLLWEAWFCVGAVLFGACVSRSRKQR